MSVLSQIVSRIPGLDDYNDQVKQNSALTSQNVQQGAQYMTLQGAMEDRAVRRATAERDASYRARMATAKTDEERAQIAMEAEGPKGVLTHLDRQSRDRATSEQARMRLMQSATNFNETKRLRQAEIDRMTSNDAKRDAQRSLDNEATAFRLQLAGEASRLAGAQGADTIMGFQPRAVPQAPTMQSPAASVVSSANASGANAPADFSFRGPDGQIVRGEAPSEGAALQALRASSQPQQTVSPAAAVVAQANGSAPDPSAWAQPTASAPQPAAPDNLDARDIRARSMSAAAAAPVPVVAGAQSVAPVVTPQTQGAPVARAVEPVMPQFSGTPRERARAENQWRLQQSKPSVAGTGGLTDDALTLAADQFLSGDNTAVQGYARDQKTRQALQNKIAERAREQGMGGKEIAAAVAEFQGFKAGQRAVGTRQAQIEMAGNVTQEFVPLALEASAAFDRTDYKTLNDVQKAIQSRTASPELRAFNFANNALINSYARAINPNGVGTVSDKDHAREILDTGFSKGDYTAAVRQLEKEIGAELKAPGSVKRGMREFFGAKPADGGAAPAAPKNVEAAVKAAGYAYEPDKYDYRVGIGGQVQRKAK